MGSVEIATQGKSQRRKSVLAGLWIGALALVGAVKSASAGILYVGNPGAAGGGNILKFDSVTGASLGTLTTGLFSVNLATYNGDIYTNDGNTQRILKISPSGTVTTFADLTSTAAKAVFTGGGAANAGLAIDSSGNVFVGDNNKHLIWKITQAGVISLFTPTAGLVNTPYGLCFDSQGQLLVADNNFGGSGSLYRYTTAGVRSTLATGLNNPGQVTVDSADNAYMGSGGSFGGVGAVYKVTPTGTLSTPFTDATLKNAGFGVGYDPTNGNLFFSTPYAGNRILKYNGTSLNNSFLTSTNGLSSPEGLLVVSSVPEPMALTMLMLPAIALLVRRQRKTIA